jgi:hypothetical protein
MMNRPASGEVPGDLRGRNSGSRKPLDSGDVDRATHGLVNLLSVSGQPFRARCQWMGTSVRSVETGAQLRVT